MLIFAPGSAPDQSFGLQLNRLPVGVTGTLSGTLQVPSLLQCLSLDFAANSLGEISEITVAGQSLMCSDKNMDAAAFRPDTKTVGDRSMGIPLDQSQQFAVTYVNMNPATSIAGFVNTDALGQRDVIPVNALGDALEYVFGLGSVTIAPGATGTLAATARRDVVVGRFGLSWAGVDGRDVRLTSLRINNAQQLSGAQGTGLPLGALSWYAEDNEGCTLNKLVPTNTTVDVTFVNDGAAPVTIVAGIFCLPSLRSRVQ